MASTESLSRYVHVCTSHGVGMPALRKAAAAEIFASQAEQQLQKGRRKPVSTAVARYVARRAPAVARALRKVLRAHAKTAASEVTKAYAERLQKDFGTDERIRQIIDELNFDDLGTDLEGELSGPMLAAFKRAAAIGATQVGFSVTDITDQVDLAAVLFAEKRGGELIKDLAGTTADAMRSLLARAVEEGMSTDELSTAVEDLGAFGDYRADLIAQTELAYAHVQGNVEGWRSSTEVQGKRWLLADTHPAPDECDDAAEAGEVGLDEAFVDGIDFPPAHPGCCLPGTVVAPGGRVSAHFARWFEGKVIEISTGRNHLAVTPNHPVLTDDGWVAAGSLKIGDHVFECVDAGAAAAAVDPDDDQVPARIEEIAGALLMAGGVATAGMPASAEAFHGDGRAHGKVDVVWAAGALTRDRETALLKRGVHQLLGFGHRQRSTLAADRHPAALGEAVLALGRDVSGIGHLSSPLGSAPRAEEQLHLAERAKRQAVSLEEIAQRGAVTVEAICHVHSGLAGLIERVQVTGVGKREFSGHVYNLSTAHGWYFANAILTHNCLCDIEPVLRDTSSDNEE